MGHFYTAGEGAPFDGGAGVSPAGCCRANVWVKDVKGRRASPHLPVWSVDSSRATFAPRQLKAWADTEEEAFADGCRRAHRAVEGWMCC